jgi:hypothetical protein
MATTVTLSASYQDLYRSTGAATPGSDGGALRSAVIPLDGNIDTATLEVTHADSTTVEIAQPPNGTFTPKAKHGGDHWGGWIVLLRIKAVTANGTAYLGSVEAA